MSERPAFTRTMRPATRGPLFQSTDTGSWGPIPGSEELLFPDWLAYPDCTAAGRQNLNGPFVSAGSARAFLPEMAFDSLVVRRRSHQKRIYRPDVRSVLP